MGIQNDIFAGFFNVDLDFNRSLKGKIPTKFKVMKENLIVDWFDSERLLAIFKLNLSMQSCTYDFGRMSLSIAIVMYEKSSG